MKIFYIFFLHFYVRFCFANLAIKRLYEDLLSDYNPLIRPVQNHNDTIHVKLSLKLTQILEINLKSQVMITNVWVEHSWYDYKLTWDPKQYDDVHMIHVPIENIWQPDIMLFNNADGTYKITLVKAHVYFTGKVIWNPPAFFKSTCEINVEWFPFDVQNCLLRFGSWTYNGLEVDLNNLDRKKLLSKQTQLYLSKKKSPIANSLNFKNDSSFSKADSSKNLYESLPQKKLQNKTQHFEIGIDLTDFHSSVEWDILAVPSTYKQIYFPGIQYPYPEITFNITMRRKSLFYTVNLVIPIIGNAFLTILVFYLPSDSKEKVTLSISVLVSLTVFFLLLVEIIPPTSLAVPLLGKYLLFTMILITLSICVTVGILNIYYRTPSTHTIAPWMRKIFIDILPKYLLIHRPSEQDFHNKYQTLNKQTVTNFCLQGCSDSSLNETIKNSNPDSSALEFLHNQKDYQGIQFNNTSFETDLVSLEPNKNNDINCSYDTDLGMPNFQPNLQYNSISQNQRKNSLASICTSDEIHYDNDIEQAISSILAIVDYIKSEVDETNIIEDWKFISLVLDRLFLWMFTLVFLFGTCIIFLQAPSFCDKSPAIENFFLHKL